MSSREPRGDLLRPDLLALGGRDVAGHEVVAAVVHEIGSVDQARRADSLLVVAPRVEGAPGWHLDQAGRSALDGQQTLCRWLVEARHRTEQAPRIRVFGSIEQLLRGAVLS